MMRETLEKRDNLRLGLSNCTLHDGPLDDQLLDSLAKRFLAHVTGEVLRQGAERVLH